MMIDKYRIYKNISVITSFFASMAYFFRQQIIMGYVQFGDSRDGIIEISILEHWKNVFLGLSRWDYTNYLYPYESALSLNDGYLLYGFFHFILRMTGLNIFVSAELVNVIIKTVGFFSFYLASRRVFSIDFPESLLGAILFTVGNGVFLHVGHQQLLTVAFVPALAVAFHGAVQAAFRGDRKYLLVWGAVFVTAYAVWLMTAFYMAWFFGIFIVVFAFSWFVISPPPVRQNLLGCLRRNTGPLLAFSGLAVLENLPFLHLYLPAASRTGMHLYAVARSFSPSLLDMINVGDSNLVWGSLNAAIRAHLRPDFPAFGEHTTGFPLTLLVLFVGAGIWVMKKGSTLQRAVFMSTVLTWIMFIHVGNFSLYWLVYHIVPGAKAVRVISRYQLFLTAPVILLVISFLAQIRSKIGWVALSVVAFVLLIEEVNLDDMARINTVAEFSLLKSIPTPPKECHAFFVSRSREDLVESPAAAGIYRHSVDAMLIAEYFNLPTINGYASFVPPGYDLFYPSEPSYPGRVSLYAAKNNVSDLCALDMQAMTWSGPDRSETWR